MSTSYIQLDTNYRRDNLFFWRKYCVFDWNHITPVTNTHLKVFWNMLRFKFYYYRGMRWIYFLIMILSLSTFIIILLIHTTYCVCCVTNRFLSYVIYLPFELFEIKDVLVIRIVLFFGRCLIKHKKIFLITQFAW